MVRFLNLSLHKNNGSLTLLPPLRKVERARLSTFGGPSLYCEPILYSTRQTKKKLRSNYDHDPLKILAQTKDEITEAFELTFMGARYPAMRDRRRL